MSSDDDRGDAIVSSNISYYTPPHDRETNEGKDCKKESIGLDNSKEVAVKYV